MREIKFRVWDRKKRQMCTPNGIYVQFNPAGTIYVKDMNENYLGCEREFDIMQYTGFVDERCNEIYEGDIVRVITDKKGVIGEVVYIPEETAFCVKAKGFEIFPLGFLNNWFEIEILGNIYQNPELLEEGK
jgi:uncharacterized phage protein (TIGR01671 family)